MHPLHLPHEHSISDDIVIKLVERADGCQFGPREISERMKIEVIDGLEENEDYENSTNDCESRPSVQLDGWCSCYHCIFRVFWNVWIVFKER